MTVLKMMCVIVAAVLVGFGAKTTVGAAPTSERTSPVKVRIGTFDSRALAIAYYRSSAFRNHMLELKTEYEKAKTAGDTVRVRELEAESSTPTWPDAGWPPSPAQQQLIHKQGFSTWPVDNVLRRVKDKIPEIAKQAGVDIVVSKWDVIYQPPGVELVDVTEPMVKAFDPDEQTLGIVKELQSQAPVPLEELKNMED